MMNKSVPRIKKKKLFFYLLVFIAMPVFTYYFGSWLDSLLSLPKFPTFPINLLVGGILFFLGLGIGIKSTRLLFFFGKGLPWGEVDTSDQSKALVTSGLYALCRNPMTLGYALLPLGMGIMFQSPTMELAVPSAVLLATVSVIKLREEPRLESRFGKAYLDYKKKTPFLIPRPRQGITYLINPLVIKIRQLRLNRKNKP